MACQSTRNRPLVGTLRTRQTSNTHSIPAIVSLQTYNIHKTVNPGKEGYTCTLCWQNFEKPCHTVGSDSRIVCVDCWRWMYDLSVCWACGEVVFRKEDAVSFGWCWWHWGCFSCLVCSAPLTPPSYLDISGKPHTGGINLHESPICNHCIDLPESIPKLEQHATVMNLPEPGKTTLGPVDLTTNRVSLFKPLQTEYQSIYTDEPKPLDVTRQKPQWMSLLPSNRNPHVQPPPHSALQRRSSFPYFSSTRFSSPFSTPPERPTTQDQDRHPVPAPATLSFIKSAPAAPSRRCPGKWPSSQSFHSSISGSETTIEGAVVPTDLSSNKPLPALAEPTLSTADVMQCERGVPNTEALQQNQIIPSSSISSLISSAMMASTKRRQSGLDDLPDLPSRPLKIRKSSMADCMPEVPDAALHKPAYFRELSGFLATRDEKLVLPSRALDRRQNPGKSLDHRQTGSKTSPALIEENIEGAISGKARVETAVGNKSCENLSVVTGKRNVNISAETDERGAEMLCKACRECPCRTRATKGLRKRLIKAYR